MKLTFCLRDRKSPKPTPIYCFVHFHRHQVKVATGTSILPKNWDVKRHRAKRGSIDEAVINTKLDTLQAEITNIFSRFMAEEADVPPDAFKAALGARKRPQAKGKQPSLFEVYDLFTEACRHRLQPATIRIHETNKGHLRAFAKAAGGT